MLCMLLTKQIWFEIIKTGHFFQSQFNKGIDW